MAKNTPLTARESGREFVKMHGLFNYFVIVDVRSSPWEPGAGEIIRTCDPKNGVGADQLIIIEPARSKDADVFIRIFNSDGSEAEACGNATRCVAWLLMEAAGRSDLVIQTGAGSLYCELVADREVCCSMGQVSMQWDHIPLSQEIDTCHVKCSKSSLGYGVALNIGNPHIVFFVPDIDDVDIEKSGPLIQNDPIFPQGVNVGFAQLVSDSQLHLKVFERGAGLTQACGSGACVAAYAALARGLTECREMTVTLPGGKVIVEISAEGYAKLTGPVTYCFSGYL